MHALRSSAHHTRALRSRMPYRIPHTTHSPTTPTPTPTTSTYLLVGIVVEALGMALVRINQALPRHIAFTAEERASERVAEGWWGENIWGVVRGVRGVRGCVGCVGCVGAWGAWGAMEYGDTSVRFVRGVRVCVCAYVCGVHPWRWRRLVRSVQRCRSQVARRGGVRLGQGAAWNEERKGSRIQKKGASCVGRVGGAGARGQLEKGDGQPSGWRAGVVARPTGIRVRPVV